MQADEIIVLQFLTEDYQRGLSFNYLSSYISALRNYLLDTVLNPYVTQKFMKGMAKLKPLKIKYAIWDVQILLQLFENISLDNYMDVSRKLVCLFVVLSASRTNTIPKLKITNMHLTDDECTFIFDELLKHSRPSYQEITLVFRAFPENPKRCPVTTLKLYLNIRLLRSSGNALLITTVASYKGVSSDTIACWILVGSRKFYIRRNNNKVDYIETGRIVIAHLLP